MLMIKYLCLALILMGGRLAQAESARFLPQGDFVERLVERVSVSGRSLVGIVNGQDRADQRTVLANPIRVLASEDRLICIRAVTQDGRYEAENTFRLQGDASGWAEVAWPTSHRSFLAQKPIQEFAILAAVGTCGQRRNRVSLTQVGPGDGMIVLVNTRGAALTATLGGSGPVRRVRCVRSPTGTRLAFDARCDFGQVPPGTYDLRIEQLSIDGGGSELLERVALVVAAAD